MTPEQVVQMVVWGVLFPAALSCVISLALWWRDQRPGAGAKSILLGLAAFAAAFCVAHGRLVGWPAFPPREAMHWLPVAAVLGVVLGCLDLFVPALRTRAASVIIVLGAGLVLPWLLPMEGRAAWVPTSLLLWAILWCGLREVAKSPTRFVPVITLGLVAACAAAGLAGSASLKQGQLAGVIAFGALGVCVAQAWRPRVSIAGPAVGVAAAVSGAALGQGVTYGSTPRGAAMLIAVAAVLAIPAALSGTVPPSSWKRVALVAGVVLAVAGAGVVYAGLSGGAAAYDAGE